MRNRGENAKTETFESFTIMGHEGLFYDGRVDRTTVPEKLFVYELVHDSDDMGTPIDIREAAFVNFFGTVITDEKIELEPYENDPSRMHKDISLDDWGYDGYSLTLDQYIREQTNPYFLPTEKDIWRKERTK